MTKSQLFTTLYRLAVITILIVIAVILSDIRSQYVRPLTTGDVLNNKEQNKTQLINRLPLVRVYDGEVTVSGSVDCTIQR
jgi:hypothetical protein